MHAEALGARSAGVIIGLFMAIIVGYSTKHNNATSAYGLTGDALAQANAALNSYGDVTVTKGGDFDAPNSLNWHVLCMTIAFSIAMTESVLAFRAPMFESPFLSGIIWHVIWQTIALAFAITAMVAVVKNKIYITSQGYTLFHMYSIHSWCGALVLFLFGLQYFSAILIFFLMKSQVAVDWRIKCGMWHATIGRLIVLGGLCTCISGWADYQMIRIAGYPPQDYYNSATMLESAIGIALAIQIAALFLFFNKDVPFAQNNHGHEIATAKVEEKTETASSGVA
jgi:hypothetical protein